ncbi:MAG: hypothetical protein HBSIN02_25000 [Bacteroidia bacterium]|nr:MAG: hypothetical protein HBSIN02_25000 [Bacteroidia bacterium]
MWKYRIFAFIVAAVTAWLAAPSGSANVIIAKLVVLGAVYLIVYYIIKPKKKRL